VPTLHRQIQPDVYLPTWVRVTDWKPKITCQEQFLLCNPLLDRNDSAWSDSGPYLKEDHYILARLHFHPIDSDYYHFWVHAKAMGGSWDRARKSAWTTIEQDFRGLHLNYKYEHSETKWWIIKLTRVCRCWWHDSLTEDRNSQGRLHQPDRRLPRIRALAWGRETARIIT